MANHLEPTQPDQTHLEFRDLQVLFGSQHVLRHINVRIPTWTNLGYHRGKWLWKNVLVKSSIGLIPPTQGQVLFDNRDLSKLNERELARTRVKYGFVFQNAALFDSMTIGQNVAFPLRQNGNYTDAQIREMVLERLAEVGLPVLWCTKNRPSYPAA